MANINKIRVSGTTYDIQDSNASKTVELTQAEFDALTVKDPNVFYVITDSEYNFDGYWTSAQTQNAIAQSVSGKQDTLVSGTNIKTINNESILGSGNIDIQGGGGKAIEAGRGISITTGETADTVSFNLPISAGTGTRSIICGGNCIASKTNSAAFGNNASAKGQQSFAINQSTASGQDSFSQGISHAENYLSAAFGRANYSKNQYELSCGSYNNSVSATTTFGDSGNTLFSVGNGTADNARHNAFEIRQNGDIYLTKDGQDVKLQDQLGGSSINVVQTTGTSTTDVMSQNAVTTQLSGYVTTDTEQIISGKKVFTYSSNSAKAIEFKQTIDTAKVGFSIKNSASANNEVASFEFRPNTFTIDGVQHPLMYFGHYRNTNTANAGVPQTVIGFRQYDQRNNAAYHYLLPLPEKARASFNLSTSFKDYYAPMGFKNGSTMITADNTGVVDLSSEFSGKVDTSLYNTYTAATDTALASKQTTLTAGTGISIVDNVISATGGGGGGTVESAITSGSTNAVESKAIWSATTFNKGVLLTFDGLRQSTNYPNGCTKLNVEVVGSDGVSDISFFNDDEPLGHIDINNNRWRGISVEVNFDGASYEISGTTVIISYPSTDVTYVRVGGETGWTYTAVVEGAWVNENTYMKPEVDAIASGLQNNINSKLDATAYTPTVVDSALYAGSTNPVKNQVLYSELRIDNGETETTLTFENSESTNYPNGCTKLNVEVVGSDGVSDIRFFNDDEPLGHIRIDNRGGVINVNVDFDGASYEISGTTVIITYPTVTSVTKIRVDGIGNYVFKAITSLTTPLKDKVAANTTALGGLSLIKLTQAEYDALSPNYDSNKLYVIVN